MANQYLNKTGLVRLVEKIKSLIKDMSKEAYLVWGGKNVAGDVSPVDAAACDDTNANRLAFHPADCIDVEYSTDGGKTWLDYEATDVNKTTLVTTFNYFYIGKKSASKATINDKLRITLTAKANQHYWHCQKILMWISTSGANGCKVLVETRHINETSFSQYGEYNLLGWGGWNSIPFSAHFSAQTNTGYVHKIRLTFTAGSVSGDYNSNLSIGKLRMIAPTCHLNANGELGLNGRIYSLSADKSVTFPNKVTATSFVGATATSTSSGLMSASDKTKLNTIKTWYDNIVGVDEDKVINKWDEIVSFLSGIPEGDTLDGLIEAVKTQVGDLKDDIEDGTVIAKEATTLGHETIGSTTKPIYLTSGVATPCTYTLGTSVPGDAKFTDNNTTYTFTGGTNKFTVTPSGGTAQDVSVTPSITNNVTYSGTLTSGQVAVLDGTAGKIKASGYTIAKSVPSNAVFTDTHYTAKNVVSNSASSTANVAAGNGDVHINLVENNTCRSGIKIVGSGATQVVSDEWGNITITSDDTNTTYSVATTSSNGLMSSAQVTKVENSVQKGDNIDLSNGKALLFGQATSETWEYKSGAGIKMLQSIGSQPDNAPSKYSVGLLVSGFYGFILARKVGTGAEALQYYGISTKGWETVLTDKNIASYTAGDSIQLGGVAASSYATKADVTDGNITAAKATTADSANAIGGKGLNDLVQGGGDIKHIKVVTSLPASPSNDTLYLIKQ